MKRVGGLWEELTGFANLLAAEEAAAAGKRKRPDVAAFRMNLEPELLRLRRELLEGSYRPGPYRTFTILDPKPRQISAAPFRDRVVHHALTRVLEPVFERRFSPHSFACRTGKGTHKALNLAREGTRRFACVLKCDVRKYFASIDHEILNRQLARVVKCKPTLDLAARIIAGSNPQEEVIQYFSGDDLFTPFARRRGLPLGNQTSQFFANVYLNGLDQAIDERLRPGVWARYVDDLVLFDDDKRRLRAMRETIEGELSEVRLSLNPRKSRIHRCAAGVTFLGWCLYPDRARLTRGNVVRFGRRMKRLQRDFAAGAIELDRVQQSVRAWIAHASFGNTRLLREKVLGRFAFGRGARPQRAGGVVQQRSDEPARRQPELERT
jgi:retron-type reverse transcriptase